VYTPSYSPVAKKLAFESGSQIFVADMVAESVDVGSIRQLTADGANFFPSWSPNGQWIAHDEILCDDGGEEADTTCGVFVLRANGGAQRFISRGRFPNWSPDGGSLIFVRQGEVWTASSSEPRTIRQITSLQDYFGKTVHVFLPSYSPDGALILVEIRTHPGVALWIVPAAGGTPTRLVEGKWPSWSRSGRLIAFLKLGDLNPDNNGTLWLYDRQTRQSWQFTTR
jgi:Tol biopolymer transport system component